MSLNESLVFAMKDLTAIEILSLLTHAKTGNENALAEAPAGAVNDAKEALEWLFEVLVDTKE
jgi:hypothetical protein